MIMSRAIYKPRSLSFSSGSEPNLEPDQNEPSVCYELQPVNMEQITTSLTARTAQKSTVSGSGSDATGSVTKRFVSFTRF